MRGLSLVPLSAGSMFQFTSEPATSQKEHLPSRAIMAYGVSKSSYRRSSYSSQTLQQWMNSPIHFMAPEFISNISM